MRVYAPRLSSPSSRAVEGFDALGRGPRSNTPSTTGASPSTSTLLEKSGGEQILDVQKTDRAPGAVNHRELIDFRLAHPRRGSERELARRNAARLFAHHRFDLDFEIGPSPLDHPAEIAIGEDADQLAIPVDHAGGARSARGVGHHHHRLRHARRGPNDGIRFPPARP